MDINTDDLTSRKTLVGGGRAWLLNSFGEKKGKSDHESKGNNAGIGMAKQYCCQVVLF